MPLLAQFKAHGHPTFRYQCTRCGGKADIQFRQSPDGKTYGQQVNLSGNPKEWLPQPVSPKDQLEIPVAYTLGNAPANARRTEVEPLTIETAYSLSPGGQQRELDPNDPSHPANIRRRIQPINPQKELF